ncbi:hypothetical protein IE53DRAFT_193314 [Violaceomyces palustris]|uniref:Uncharacterized protein n=1 Tax=Violaceomyces palustris TaxID=1673888 RepID=A0ACD0P592_9BASI|nr:hypothetical protein IE53DRAFT_193314 [Violaceomyces palustris]
MSANYWLSTQCNNWLLDRTQLSLARQEDSRYATKAELGAICIWCANVISTLCKRLSLRQRATATACVFLRRFFAKNSYSAVDPCLVMAACVYVAAKVEECPVHIKSVVGEAVRMFGEMGHRAFPQDNSSLAEMEFYLLEELEFDLIIYHPYRSLIAISDSVGAGSAKAKSSKDQAVGALAGGQEVDPGNEGKKGGAIGLGLGLIGNAVSDEYGVRGLQESAEVAAGIHPSDGEETSGAQVKLEELDEQALQMAWFVLNDTYKSEICLLYPPHLIAIAAIWLALILHPPACEKIKKSREAMQERRRAWIEMMQAGIEAVEAEVEEEFQQAEPSEGAKGTTSAIASSSSEVGQQQQQSIMSSFATDVPPFNGRERTRTLSSARTMTSGVGSGSNNQQLSTNNPAALPGGGASNLSSAGQATNPATSIAEISASSSSPSISSTTAITSSGLRRPNLHNHHSSPPNSTTNPSSSSAQQQQQQFPPPMPMPPPEEALTFLAGLNVSIPLLAEIVQEMISLYELEASLGGGQLSDNGAMLKRLERMREARRKRLLRERASAVASSSR